MDTNMMDLSEDVLAHYQELMPDSNDEEIQETVSDMASLLQDAARYLHEQESLLELEVENEETDPDLTAVSNTSYNNAEFHEAAIMDDRYDQENQEMAYLPDVDEPVMQMERTISQFTPINGPVGQQIYPEFMERTTSNNMLYEQSVAHQEHQAAFPSETEMEDFDLHDYQPQQKRARLSGPDDNQDEMLDVHHYDEEMESSPVPATNNHSNSPTQKRASAKKAIKGSYGVTPFPDFGHPTLEEVKQVFDILTAEHGEQKRPEKLTASLTFTGCGEVPTILDAILRTVISANTSTKNSCTTLKNVIEKFGTKDGTVNWEAVHHADFDSVLEAMNAGGLGKIKTKFVKTILQDTEKECLELGIDHLSLEHLRELDTAAVMKRLQEFSGVGVKIAACVVLYCLQRPALAIDTHCHHLARLLNWIPAGADADKTFYHLDAVVPDEYKYALHQLFMAHGQNCKLCNAQTLTLMAKQELKAMDKSPEGGSKKRSYKKEVVDENGPQTCVLEDLVDRRVIIETHKTKATVTKLKKEKAEGVTHEEDAEVTVERKEVKVEDVEAVATTVTKKARTAKVKKEGPAFEDDANVAAVVAKKPRAPKKKKDAPKEEVLADGTQGLNEDTATVAPTKKPRAPRKRKVEEPKEQAKIDNAEDVSAAVATAKKPRAPRKKKVEAPKELFPDDEETIVVSDKDTIILNSSTASDEACEVSPKPKAPPKSRKTTTKTETKPEAIKTTQPKKPKAVKRAITTTTLDKVNQTEAPLKPTVVKKSEAAAVSEAPRKITLGPKAKKAAPKVPVILDSQEEGEDELMSDEYRHTSMPLTQGSKNLKRKA